MAYQKCPSTLHVGGRKDIPQCELSVTVMCLHEMFTLLYKMSVLVSRCYRNGQERSSSREEKEG